MQRERVLTELGDHPRPVGREPPNTAMSGAVEFTGEATMTTTAPTTILAETLTALHTANDEARAIRDPLSPAADMAHAELDRLLGALELVLGDG